jgi:hypothetical protein
MSLIGSLSRIIAAGFWYSIITTIQINIKSRNIIPRLRMARLLLLRDNLIELIKKIKVQLMAKAEESLYVLVTRSERENVILSESYLYKSVSV